MMVTLPPEFADLAGKVTFIQRKNNNEFSSTCPKCGGSLHSDGTLPDRFVMIVKSRYNGHPFGFCRMCNYKWWQGQDSGNEVDPQTIALLEQQAREYRERLAAERQEKLAKFTTGELWAELHRRMQSENRQWWRDNGIPDDWQDYLRLGYTPEKIYTENGATLKSPAYTIPYFHNNWQFVTMQYRLVDPNNPQCRYRFEARLGSSYYMTTPSLPIKKKVVICEGAKKAVVALLRSGMMDDTTFLAIPSKEDWRESGILEAVKPCERVWVLLDPDCWTPPENDKAWKPSPVALAEAIGNTARIVDLPIKVDDAFLGYGLGADEFKASLYYARRL